MTDLSGRSVDPLPEVTAHYEVADEAGRLLQMTGQLEAARTREILTRYLPAPPAVILDVGGGAGIYALWLAELGYTVHLIDPAPSTSSRRARLQRRNRRIPLPAPNSATRGRCTGPTPAPTSCCCSGRCITCRNVRSGCKPGVRPGVWCARAA